MQSRRRARRLLLVAALAAASPAFSLAPRPATKLKTAAAPSFARAARLAPLTLPGFSPQSQLAFQAVSVELSGRRLPAEQSKGLSASLFDGALRLPVVAQAAVSGAGLSLERGDASAERRDPPPPPRPSASRLDDAVRYARLYAKNLHWYTVTHIKTLWPAYARARASAVARGEQPSVSRPRAFFSWMRVMGASGPFYVLGFVAREDAEVVAEARAAFQRYFRADAEAARSFEAYLERARAYNAERRALSNLRKHVRDALLAASLKPASELAAHFDGLLRSDETGAFQGAEQQERLEQLRRAVLAALRAEDAAAPDRVLGVILMGSFARGGATPTSDIDLQALTADGSGARVRPFALRLKGLWAGLGLQDANPVSVQDFPFYPSKRLIGRVHHSPYLVIAADPALEAALSRAAGDPPPEQPRRALDWRGHLWRAFQFVTVYGATFLKS